MTSSIDKDWHWAERRIEDTGEIIAGDAASSWHWTGRQLGRAGSAAAEGVVGTIGWVDSRVASTVPGHVYVTLIPLGTFHRVTPKLLLDTIRHNPGSFPIPGDKNFELGAVVTLSFFGTRNPVIVEKIDTSDPNRASMLLRTQNGHFFRGTAEHIILQQANGQLAYKIVGNGPPRELWDRNRINMLFGRYEWPSLVRQRVLPLAKQLEQARP